MKATVSALADKSSIPDRGRAFLSAVADYRAMDTDEWRVRLTEAIKAKGLSMRAASLAAGFAPGYVHSILKDGKDPSVDHLIAVSREAGVSLLWVLYGIQASPATERLIRMLEADPGTRAAVMQLLEGRSAAPSRPAET